MKYRMLIKMDSEAFIVAAGLLRLDLSVIYHKTSGHPKASYIPNYQMKLVKIMNWKLCYAPTLIYLDFC
jgi:hypothetical protein